MIEERITNNNWNYVTMSNLRDIAIADCPQLYDALQTRGFSLLASGSLVWLTRKNLQSRESVNILTREEASRVDSTKVLHQLIRERTLLEFAKMDLDQL